MLLLHAANGRDSSVHLAPVHIHFLTGVCGYAVMFAWQQTWTQAMPGHYFYASS